jgi:two-component system, NtrC family, sensor histidine kinase HydH
LTTAAELLDNVKDLNESERDTYLIRIISGIAHEIRNPLQGIIASLAAISWRLDNDPSAHPFLQMIQHEVSRINSMIDNMLILRQPIVMDENPHDLSKLIEDTVQAVKEDAEKSQATIRFSPLTEPLRMVADGHRLTRAMEAILKNAIESKPEQANVEIRVTRTGADECSIVVRDDGSGITNEDRARLFEPFFTTKPKKMGLGLFLAERVIRGHKGRIEIDGQKAPGTEFTVYLPLSS